jgi:hypothetical protein
MPGCCHFLPVIAPGRWRELIRSRPANPLIKSFAADRGFPDDLVGWRTGLLAQATHDARALKESIPCTSMS